MSEQKMREKDPLSLQGKPPAAVHLADKYAKDGQLRCVVTRLTDESCALEFNARLSYQGEDYRIYANTFETTEFLKSSADKETGFFIALILELMSDDLGVELITVKPYKLILNHSRAVRLEAFKDRLEKLSQQFQRPYGHTA